MAGRRRKRRVVHGADGQTVLAGGVGLYLGTQRVAWWESAGIGLASAAATHAVYRLDPSLLASYRPPSPHKVVRDTGVNLLGWMVGRLLSEL